VFIYRCTKTQYPGFHTGRYNWEAECFTCSGGTYISVANKGALDLKAHIETPKFVAISAHNANTEGVFSLMQSKFDEGKK